MYASIFGAGYMGLVTGASFAEMGNSVNCVDTDVAKVESLKQVHEPGLEVLVASNLREGRRSAPRQTRMVRPFCATCWRWRVTWVD